MQPEPERQKDIERSFDEAKQYLLDNILYYSGNPAKARSAANFIRECMLADGQEDMHSWNREKGSSLVSLVEDLLRRNQTSHPGFQMSKSEIEKILYQVSAPAEWISAPPYSRF